MISDIIYINIHIIGGIEMEEQKRLKCTQCGHEGYIVVEDGVLCEKCGKKYLFKKEYSTDDFDSVMKEYTDEITTAKVDDEQNSGKIKKEVTNKNKIENVLSFFVCGLGQIYKGSIKKGLIYFLSHSICAFLSLLALSNGLSKSFGLIVSDSSSIQLDPFGNSIPQFNAGSTGIDFGLVIALIVPFAVMLVIWISNLYDINKMD
jgi:DNA-directed RNA polymerase subunit RPC12/RpoP